MIVASLVERIMRGIPQSPSGEPPRESLLSRSDAGPVGDFLRDVLREALREAVLDEREACAREAGGARMRAPPSRGEHAATFRFAGETIARAIRERPAP